MKPYIRVVCLAAAIVFGSTPALAAGTTFSVINFYPNPDTGHFFRLLDSKTLQQWQFSTGAMAAYTYKPLVDASETLISHIWEGHAYAGLGFFDWLELTAALPVAMRYSFVDPTPATAPAAIKKTDIGDLQLMAKWNIVPRDRFPVGFSFAPFVLIPTGAQTRFVGETSVIGGGDFILDVEVQDRLSFALNAGLSVGEETVFRNMDRSLLRMRLGAGMRVALLDALSLMIEGHANTPTNHLFTDSIHSVAEVIAGVQYAIPHTGLLARVGGGTGVVRGVGSPTARTFAGLHYVFTPTVGAPQSHPRKAATIAALAQSVTFGFNNYRLTREAHVALFEVAQFMAHHPEAHLVVEAYTDAIGSTRGNQDMSDARATSVVDFLVSVGVDAARLEAHGMGATNFVATNDTPEGRAENRRIVFRIIK